MFEDIYVLYILFKYKIGTISRVELFKEFREYVKSKGLIFIKLLQTPQRQDVRYNIDNFFPRSYVLNEKTQTLSNW